MLKNHNIQGIKRFLQAQSCENVPADAFSFSGNPTALVVQGVKNLPAMWETWVQSLGCKDLLEKGMVTHSSILAGESPGQRSLAGYSSWGCKESDTTETKLPLDRKSTRLNSSHAR